MSGVCHAVAMSVVMVGGVQAPGFPGEMQINLNIPSRVPHGVECFADCHIGGRGGDQQPGDHRGAVREQGCSAVPVLGGDSGNE